MQGFSGTLTEKEIKNLEEQARLCRGDIIKMTTVAGSGHPGGSMSSIDIYLTVYKHARISPDTVHDLNRDRIIASHGHTSPGLYACLARLGFINPDDLLALFRKAESPYEGHIERHVPGVEWTTGNLGQGLSAGCGFALAARLNGLDYNTFVVMSDGEQAKGQVGEARRFARKYDLNTLTVIIDHNHIQISGRTEDIMPVNIKDNFLADGWRVLEISGHNFREIYEAVKQSISDRKNPYAIIAETVIGKGVSFMENKREYHGRALNMEECSKALNELGVENDVDNIRQARRERKAKTYEYHAAPLPALNVGSPKEYDDDTHPRVVFGSVLKEIAQANPQAPFAVLDCDLAESVKSNEFAKARPQNFFEAGVSEHSTATTAGALSISGVVTVWADFGVFAIDETYNQMRLNDINHTNLKVCATHLGYNVGPDGKTHHCIDYVGLLKNLPGFKFIIPGDPNQTDHAVRYLMTQGGNYIIGISRSKLPVITTPEGSLFYDANYKFEYGKCDLIRDGADCAIFTYGPTLPIALSAWTNLRSDGVNAAVYNVPCPLDICREALTRAALSGLIITYEDHIADTGLGSTVANMIARDQLKARLVKIGIDQYGVSDEHDTLYKKYGLDAETLVRKIKEHI
ncbi:MAG: transketolase [candidate division WOR-3 bacterium]|nr:MAG: transketolase [candidate division WOR-3 bacterium]